MAAVVITLVKHPLETWRDFVNRKAVPSRAAEALNEFDCYQRDREDDEERLDAAPLDAFNSLWCVNAIDLEGKDCEHPNRNMNGGCDECGDPSA